MCQRVPDLDQKLCGIDLYLADALARIVDGQLVSEIDELLPLGLRRSATGQITLLPDVRCFHPPVLCSSADANA